MNKFRTPFGRKMVSIIGQHGWLFSQETTILLSQSFYFEKHGSSIEGLSVQPVESVESGATVLQHILAARCAWLSVHTAGVQRVRALRKHWVMHRWLGLIQLGEVGHFSVIAKAEGIINGVDFVFNDDTDLRRRMMKDIELVDSTKAVCDNQSEDPCQNVINEVFDTFRHLRVGVEEARKWVNRLTQECGDIDAVRLCEWRTPKFRVSVYRMPPTYADLATVDGDELAHRSGFVPHAMHDEYDRQMDDLDNQHRELFQLKVVVKRNDIAEGAVDIRSPIYLLTKKELHSPSVIRRLRNVAVKDAIKTYRGMAAKKAHAAADK